MAEVNTVKVDDANFEGEVIKSDLPVLVDFWAPWCGPCQIAGPILEKIADEYQGKAKVCKVNVDEGRQTAAKYGVMSIPTLSFFKGGEVKAQIVGVTPDFEGDIKKKIEAIL